MKLKAYLVSNFCILHVLAVFFVMLEMSGDRLSGYSAPAKFEKIGPWRYWKMLSLPSDLVLDVVRAADRSQANEARQRLVGLSGSVQKTGMARPSAGHGVNAFSLSNNSSSRSDAPSYDDPFFSQLLTQGDLQKNGETNGNLGQSPITSPSKFSSVDSPFAQFEAFLLRKFIDSMLPSQSENFFGKGTAGAMWKSLLSEQIGLQIARSGGIGVGNQINTLIDSAS